jgi:hypothetical protein
VAAFGLWIGDFRCRVVRAKLPAAAQTLFITDTRSVRQKDRQSIADRLIAP